MGESHTEPSATRQTHRLLKGRAKRGFGLFANDKQRLWLAEDHLLVVTQSYLTERYKRFYLNDIQAITIQKSSAGAILNTILLILVATALVLVTAAVLSEWPEPAYVIPAILAGFFTSGALINASFGPTCVCHVLTAIHEEPLFCLGRLRTALRVVEQLRVEIEAVQGGADALDRAGGVHEPSQFAGQEMGGA
ncbi:MAG: hypothetical protein SGI88_18000 [Candidatus Hydrogenedentes bacterium]|nr:hypothetical protein [Candidatus Hydrogenedentota bacterium]